jgi:predicted transcriptional regulator
MQLQVRSSCSNSMCSCDPCGCDSCTCNGARLGDLERRVMGILWHSSDRQMTVRQTADELPGYAYTTVATVLDRLVHKGMVKRSMNGRTIWFAAIGTKGAHTAVLMRRALAEDDDPDAALMRFVENLSNGEAAALRRALKKVGRKPSEWRTQVS